MYSTKYPFHKFTIIQLDRFQTEMLEKKKSQDIHVHILRTVLISQIKDFGQ